MTIVADYRLTVNGDFSAYNQLQCNGSTPAGTSVPQGVAGFIEKSNYSPDGGPAVPIKFQLRNSDPTTAQGIRSEYIAQTDAIGSERWYYWRTYIPAGSWKDSEQMTIMQIHDTPDGGDAGKEPTIRMYTDGKFIVVRNCYDPNATTTSNSATARDLCKIPFAYNTWIDLVLHAVWSATAGSGTTEVYANRRLVFKETSHINCANDTVGGYFKAGIYDYSHVSNFAPKLCYGQGVVIGDSAYATFAAFMAAIGVSDTQLETLIPGVTYMSAHRTVD
jgi:hypothetical protein